MANTKYFDKGSENRVNTERRDSHKDFTIGEKSSRASLVVDVGEVFRNQSSSVEQKRNALAMVNKNNLKECAKYLIDLVFDQETTTTLYNYAFNILGRWVMEGDEKIADLIFNQLRKDNRAATIDKFVDFLNLNEKMFARKMVVLLSDSTLSYDIRISFLDFIVTTQDDNFISEAGFSIDREIKKIIDSSKAIIDGDMIWRSLNLESREEGLVSIREEVSGVSSLLLRITASFSLSEESKEAICDFGCYLSQKGHVREGALSVFGITSPSSILCLNDAADRLEKILKEGKLSKSERNEYAEFLDRVRVRIKEQTLALSPMQKDYSA